MASLLIEIQTEELPPKALDNLSKAFAKELASSLKEQGLALPERTGYRLRFSSPYRRSDFGCLRSGPRQTFPSETGAGKSRSGR